LDIRNLLRNVSNREKIFIYVALVLLISFLIYQIVFVPLLRARKEYEVEWAELEARFHELKVLAERYVAEKNNYDTLLKMFEEKRALSVLTYLENVAEDVGIRENIEYIKPKGNESKNSITKTMVEIKIDAISISDLMLFTYRIEEGRNGLIVSYLRLKPFFKNREKVDTIIRITDAIIE